MIRTSWERLGHTLAVVPVYTSTGEGNAKLIDNELLRLELLAKRQTITDNEITTIMQLWTTTKLSYISLKQLMNTLGIDTEQMVTLQKKVFIETLQ